MSKVVSSVFRRGLFREQVAIVTGGGTGIGYAITQELLHLGKPSIDFRVVVAARNLDRLRAAEQQLAAQFGEGGGASPVLAVQCNIRREDEVRSLVTRTVAHFGRLDLLVNNAGGQFPSAAADLSLKGWNAVVETNLTGTFLVCREVYQQWMKDHGGSIVTIITDMFKGWPMMAHSGAARAGVDNLTKSLALEWAKDGIRVNAVAPGSSIYSETAAANYADPRLFEKNIESIPAKRLGKPEEVSAAVCYLLSPAAAYVTGATLRIDGGASLYRQMFLNIPHHDKMPAYSWQDDDTSKSKI